MTSTPLVSGPVFALMTAACWSVAVILFKRSGDGIHPLGLNLLKNLVVLPLFAVSWLLVGQAVNTSAPAFHYPALFASGVVGIGLADTFFFQSLNLLGAARTAILDCSYSPFIVGLSHLLLGERLSPIDAAGAALIMGAVLLISIRRADSPIERRDLAAGIGLGLAAMALMGGAIVAIKPLLSSHDVLFTVTVRTAGGVAALLPWVWLSPSRAQAMAALRPQPAWRYALPGTFMGTYLALIFWVAGFKYAEASIASILNQTSTLLIVVLAAVFLREPIGPRGTLAVVLGTAGSMLVLI